MHIGLSLKDILFGCLAALMLFAPARAGSDAKGVLYADIPDGAYSIIAQVRAKPGKEDELREATLPLVKLVRGDPANLVYFLQEDRETRGRFVFYEVFATVEDFEAHNNMPYVQDWFAKLSDLAEGGVTVTRMEILQKEEVCEQEF